MIKTGKQHSERGLARRIGTNLKAHRLAREETQSSVARALRLTSTYVGLVERGRRLLSLPALGRWCAYFGVDLGDVCEKAAKGKGDPRRKALILQLSEMPIRALRRAISLADRST